MKAGRAEQVKKDRASRAGELFFEGYNCAQSVFCAFDDVTGFDRDLSARLASSFGGGLGRLREVCGAVSGAAMVLGAARGYADPEDRNAKKEHYERVRAFAEKFRESEGSIICRELLAGSGNAAEAAGAGGDPRERTAEYYRDRPCPGLVMRAARILEEMLKEPEQPEQPE